MDQQTNQLFGKFMMLVGLGLFLCQIGCSSTASNPLHAFQPRPFSSRAGYAPQQAYYPGYPGYPQNAVPGGFAPQQNPGLDLQPGNDAWSQPGIQANAQPSRWPNLRFPNPLGFAGTNC